MLKRLIFVGMLAGLAVGPILCLLASIFNPWFCHDLAVYVVLGLVIPALWSGAWSLPVGFGIWLRWRGDESSEVLKDTVRLGLSISAGIWITTMAAVCLWMATANLAGSIVVGSASGAALAVVRWKILGSGFGKQVLRLFSNRVFVVVSLSIVAILPPLIGVRAESRHLAESNGSKPVTLVYMVDGAEWNVINPMIEQGRLPTFELIKRKGAWGSIATGPVNNAPANFTSLITGFMPEKSGIKDFFHNRWWLKRKTVFDVAHGAGYRVGIFQWLIHWPPVSYNGFCVPGWQAWDNRTLPEEISFLREMKTGMVGSLGVPHDKELLYLFKAVPYGLTLNTFLDYLRYVLFLPDGHYLDKYQSKTWFYGKFDADIIIGLIRTFKTDLVAYAWYNLDPASHIMWIYHEPDKFSRQIEPELLKKYSDFIRDEYIWIDENLGAVLKRLPHDIRLAVVSDHGFGFDKRPVHMVYPVRKKEMLRFVGLFGRVKAQVMGEEFIVKPLEGASVPEGIPNKEYIADRFRNIKVRELDSKFFTVEIVPGGVRVTRFGPHKFIDLSEAHLVLGNKVVKLKKVIMPLYGTGRHYEKGIIILYGDNVKAQTFMGDHRMVDFAPTLSAWLGLPFPVDADGSLIEGVLSKEWLKTHPPQRLSIEQSTLESSPVHEKRGD